MGILIERLNKDDVVLTGAKSGDRHGIEDLRLNQFSKRYIHHILARITAHVEMSCDAPNRFPEYVARDVDDPFEVEHIWADHFEDHKDEFSTAEEYREFRNNIGGLLLLPASFNRSFQDKSYEEKLPTIVPKIYWLVS